MPWTAEDMVQKGCKGDASACAAQANEIRARCLTRGGSESECDGIAIATALKHANKPTIKKVKR